MIGEILAGNGKFLQNGYNQNILLFSGPMNPRTGE